MPKISGTQTHLARLRDGAGPKALDIIGGYLFIAGQLVQADAQYSITEGAVSGKNHVPSRPGEPPNEDSGYLRNNIEVNSGDRKTANQVSVEVSSNAPYAAPLELGSSRMAARPYLVPALAKNRDNIARKVAAGVNKANRTDG